MSFTICPHIVKIGARYPLTTKKQEGGGGGFVLAGTIFSAQSAGVYGWVTSIEVKEPFLVE